MNNASRDFLHHLHDTLVLLGCEARFTELVGSLGTITAADVSRLRRYNGELIDGVKGRLVNINKIAVEVVTDV